MARTVIVGLGTLGLEVCEALCRLGEEVSVVYLEAPSMHVQRARNAGATINRCSNEEEVLDRCQIPLASCLVLSESKDLRNLDVALQAMELNVNLRVVIQVFDTDLANRAAKLLPKARVLSSSAIASPILAGAALGQSAHNILNIWDYRFELKTLPAEVLVHLSDRFGIANLGPVPPLVSTRSSWAPALTRFRRAFLALFDRRLGAVSLLALILALVSIGIFGRFVHLSLVNSIYFTIATMSTTGYGDISLLHAPAWIRLFDVGLIILSTICLASLYALITDAIVGVRIAHALGRPERGLKGHIVVCGLGHVGSKVALQLFSQGQEIAVCELHDPGRFVQSIRRVGIPVQIGDARQADTLESLSIKEARAIVAATSDDLTNLEIVLLARELQPNIRTVARLSDRALATRAVRFLGIDASYSTAAMASQMFVAASIGDEVLGVVLEEGEPWLIVEYTLPVASSRLGLLTGDTINPIAMRMKEGLEWAPSLDISVSPGDKILCITRLPGLTRLRSLPQILGQPKDAYNGKQ